MRAAFWLSRLLLPALPVICCVGPVYVAKMSALFSGN
jgi:hypothetical protein